MDQGQANAFIGIAEVKRISGFSKSTILRKIKAGAFPVAVISEGNCTRWDLAEVLEWRQSQFLERERRERKLTEARA